VEVDTGTGTSTVRVVNGTVSVKNILKNSTMFLSAGFKTTVAMNTDPLVPRPMLSTDISALKGWAPPDVVGRAMSEQLTEAGREHDVLTGNLKKKLLVMPFVNSSKYNGSWNITSGIARMLTGKLQHGPCTVEFADSSSAADPVIAAGKAQARFVVTGEIQDFDIAQHAEITASADEYREFYFARVRIAIQMIDITDQRVVVDNVFSGDMRGANSKENSWPKISALIFSDQDPKFLKSILGAALVQAIEQAAEQLTKQLAAE
jgi:TolB-like protein